jgi:hypothetical protein
LRHGDPISPYLFVICMEVLSLLFSEAVDSKALDFNPKCSKVHLYHLCFTEDLLIFYVASLSSIQAIKAVLARFIDLSGLTTNPSKSLVFCAGVPDIEKNTLLDCLQMC